MTRSMTATELKATILAVLDEVAAGVGGVVGLGDANEAGLSGWQGAVVAFGGRGVPVGLAVRGEVLGAAVERRFDGEPVETLVAVVSDHDDSAHSRGTLEVHLPPGRRVLERWLGPHFGDTCG